MVTATPMDNARREQNYRHHNEVLWGKPEPLTVRQLRQLRRMRRRYDVLVARRLGR